MGRMSPKDPDGLSGRTSSLLPPEKRSGCIRDYSERQRRLGDDGSKAVAGGRRFSLGWRAIGSSGRGSGLDWQAAHCVAVVSQASPAGPNPGPVFTFEPRAPTTVLPLEMCDTALASDAMRSQTLARSPRTAVPRTAGDEDQAAQPGHGGEGGFGSEPAVEDGLRGSQIESHDLSHGLR